MNQSKIYFASEPNAGLHPKVIEAIVRVNEGKCSSYREDEQTQRMLENFNNLFGQKVKALVFNTGTAANVVAIASIAKPYNSIICSKSGHINTYEAGGPTRFSGCTLDVLPTKNGKITIDQIQQILDRRPKENAYAQPKVVFITQPTELGILWTIDELEQLSSFCKSKGLYLFMDGARIANAVSKLNIDIREITTEIGLDALTWGGIKNGGLVDVLIFLNTDIAQDVDFIYKQFGQDVAHSRFYAATVNALLENNLWLKNAKTANEMAIKLYDGIKTNPKVKIVLPVEINMVWSVISNEMDEQLSKRFSYFKETNDIDVEEFENYPFFTRWVTSWATTEDEINLFAQAINSL